MAGCRTAPIRMRGKRAFDVGRPFVAKYEGGERRIDVLEFVTICRAIGADSSKLLKSLKKSIGLP
jgi:hypothetical protein